MPGPDAQQHRNSGEDETGNIDANDKSRVHRCESNRGNGTLHERHDHYAEFDQKFEELRLINVLVVNIFCGQRRHLQGPE